MDESKGFYHLGPETFDGSIKAYSVRGGVVRLDYPLAGGTVLEA